MDLLAVDTPNPKRLGRYHIECGVSIYGSFSKLTAKEFSAAQLKQRVQAPAQRRMLGFFIERKFDVSEVHAELAKYGFADDNYNRIVVTWDATPDPRALAAERKIALWDFRDLLLEIADAHQKRRTYFTDDTARTIQLFAMAAQSKVVK